MTAMITPAIYAKLGATFSQEELEACMADGTLVVVPELSGEQHVNENES